MRRLGRPELAFGSPSSLESSDPAPHGARFCRDAPAVSTAIRDGRVPRMGGLWHVRARHDLRALQGLRSQGRRAALVRVLGGARRLRRERRPGRHAARLRRADAAAQRDRLAPHGARAQLHARGRARPLAPHARVQHALAAGHRSRRHRHADRGRAAARARGQDAATTSGARSSSSASGSGRRRAAGASPSSSACSGVSADWPRTQVHDGPGHDPRRARGVRPPLRGGAHLPRHAPHQLGLRGADRALRPRGRERGGQRRALRVRVPGRGRRRARSSSPRRAPRRCSATPPSPFTPTTRATRTCTASTSCTPSSTARSPSSPTPSSSTPSSAPAR